MGLASHFVDLLSGLSPKSLGVHRSGSRSIDGWEDDPLYRKLVLGESYEEQASRCGVSAATLRQRANRRACQLRRDWADRSR